VRSIKAKDTDELVGLGDAYNLTPSEETVLQKMMRGNNVEKIARSSNTSPETVRTHVRRAYSKMSVSSREEMFSRLKPFLFDR
jgi:DNA-binding NarL/FixJ family response regulator